MSFGGNCLGGLGECSSQLSQDKRMTDGSCCCSEWRARTTTSLPTALGPGGKNRQISHTLTALIKWSGNKPNWMDLNALDPGLTRWHRKDFWLILEASTLCWRNGLQEMDWEHSRWSELLSRKKFIFLNEKEIPKAQLVQNLICGVITSWKIKILF